MESKLKRRVAVQTAAVDYFTLAPEQAQAADSSSKQTSSENNREEWIERIYAPSYHIEKLKEEVLRAKRYNHALSAIMLDIDNFSKINEQYSHRVGDELLTVIVKIVRKSIRNVDIISRFSGDVFLIILPNTNKREAAELEERIRQNIPVRTQRMEQLGKEVTATLSVAQCQPDENAAEFIQRIQTMLESGKKNSPNAVYSS